MKKVIRSSDIGAYLYCKRAWWYGRSGAEPSNQAEMHAGTALHERHGRRVIAAGFLRALAVIFFVAAILLSVAYCTAQIL
jgi:CRISPR/Cas system-associated exonuclease Cas4 (RecB family)